MSNREKSGDEQFPLKPAWGVTCSNFNLICRSSWSSQSSSWNVKCVTGEIFTNHPGCQMLRQGHLMSEICLIVTTRHFYHRQPNWKQRYFDAGKMLIFFLRLLNWLLVFASDVSIQTWFEISWLGGWALIQSQGYKLLVSARSLLLCIVLECSVSLN